MKQTRAYSVFDRIFPAAITALGMATVVACAGPLPSDAELVAHFEANRELYETVRDFAKSEVLECQNSEGREASIAIRMHAIKRVSDDEFSYETESGNTCAETVSEADYNRLASIANELDQNFLIIEHTPGDWFSFVRFRAGIVTGGTLISYDYTPAVMEETFDSIDEAVELFRNEGGYVHGYRPLSDGWRIRISMN